MALAGGRCLADGGLLGRSLFLGRSGGRDRGLLGGLGLGLCLRGGLDLSGLRCRLGLYCGLSLCLGSSSLGRGLLSRCRGALARGGLGGRLCLDSYLGLGLGGRLLDFGSRLCGSFVVVDFVAVVFLAAVAFLAVVVLDAVVFLAAVLAGAWRPVWPQRREFRPLPREQPRPRRLSWQLRWCACAWSLSWQRWSWLPSPWPQWLLSRRLTSRGLLCRRLRSGLYLRFGLRLGSRLSLHLRLGLCGLSLNRLLLSLGLLGSSGCFNNRLGLGLGLGLSLHGRRPLDLRVHKEVQIQILVGRARPAKVLAHGLRDQLVPGVTVVPEQACRAEHGVAHLVAVKVGKREARTSPVNSLYGCTVSFRPPVSRTMGRVP